MAELRRRRKKASASQEAAPLPAYITRTAPVYEIRNEAQITAIEDAEEDILEQIGGDALVLVPAYGPPFGAATDIKRRYGTLEDFNNFVRLAHMSPEMRHTGGPICEPTDIPVSKRHLDLNYDHPVLSNKCFMGAVASKERAEGTIEMCEVEFGKGFVADNCVVSARININSPLVLDGQPRAERADSFE